MWLFKIRQTRMFLQCQHSTALKHGDVASRGVLQLVYVSSWMPLVSQNTSAAAHSLRFDKGWTQNLNSNQHTVSSRCVSCHSTQPGVGHPIVYTMCLEGKQNEAIYTPSPTDSQSLQGSYRIQDKDFYLILHVCLCIFALTRWCQRQIRSLLFPGIQTVYK